MPISISDVIINIDKHTQINWVKDAIIPFASVFLGAILAHNFNINRDKSKKLDELSSKMMVVCNKSDFLLGNLMSYNEFLVETIEEKFNINPLEAAVNPIFLPDFSYFTVTPENYAFLANYNHRFLYLIEQLNRQLQLLASCALTYKNKINLNSLKIEQKNFQEEDLLTTIECLRTLRNSLEPTIEFAYVLNCQLNSCCSKYFNFLYIDNIENINYIKESYKKYMFGIDEVKQVKALNAIFEKYWIYPLNFPSRIALLYRKFKFRIRYISSYFLLDKIFKNKR